MLTRIKNDQLNARKARDSLASSLLTSLYSEAAMVGKNVRNGLSTDEEVIQTIKKFVKNSEETLARAIEGGRSGLADATTKEIEILRSYLPSQVSTEQLETEVRNFVLNNVEAKIGDVMKFLKETFSGRFDSKEASVIAKNVLGGK